MEPMITIVGCGPGSVDYVTVAAIKAVEHAQVLVGAQRLLDLFPESDAERIAVTAKIGEVIEQVEKRIDRVPVTVLVSGDPGMFSLAKLVVGRFGRNRCRVIPGVGSVQTAFARIGLDWADARIISAHKEDPDEETVASLVNESKIAVLAGRPSALQWVARLVRRLEGARRIFACEDLTMTGERVQEVAPDRLEQLDASSRTVILIIKDEILS